MSLRKRVLYFVSSSTKTESGQCRQHEETSTPPLSFWRVGGGARKEPAGRAGQGRLHSRSYRCNQGSASIFVWFYLLT